MFSLFDLSLILALIALAAWFWRGHGIREHALLHVRRRCEREDVILLDDNVALRGFAWERDARGHKRLARVYGFEFTCNGEQRLGGRICMFGFYPGRIDMQPRPFEPVPEDDDKVVRLDDWRRSHSRSQRDSGT